MLAAVRAPRRVGHCGARPSASQAAAAVAAKTASDTWRGQRSSRRWQRGPRASPSREYAEGADGEVEHLAALVDRDALAPHPAEGLVDGSQAVGPQCHRVEGSAGGHLDRHGSVRADRYGGHPPPRAVTVTVDPGLRPRRARSARRSPHWPRPSRRRAARRPRVARYVDELDRDAGAAPRRRLRSRRARSQPYAPRAAPRSVRRSPRATGGRLWPWRTTSSSTRPRARPRHARRPTGAPYRDRRVPLPTEGTPIGQRGGGHAAGSTRRRRAPNRPARPTRSAT